MLDISCEATDAPIRWSCVIGCFFAFLAFMRCFHTGPWASPTGRSHGSKKDSMEIPKPNLFYWYIKHTSALDNRFHISFSKSSMAEPSAKNSGLDRISNFTPLPVFSKMFLIAWAVRTGRVDFSTTILSLVATLAMVRADISMYFRSAA